MTEATAKHAPDGTMTKLPADLRLQPQTETRDMLITRAEAGEFDDFRSRHATPKIICNRVLQAAGYPELAAKLRNGDYD